MSFPIFFVGNPGRLKHGCPTRDFGHDRSSFFLTTHCFPLSTFPSGVAKKPQKRAHQSFFWRFGVIAATDVVKNDGPAKCAKWWFCSSGPAGA